MEGTFRTVVEVLDFGPYVSRVIVNFGESLEGADPEPSDFEIHVTRHLMTDDVEWPAYMGERPSFPMEGEREVTDAFVSNEEGTADPKGNCVTLLLACDPRDGLGSIIRFNGVFNCLVGADYEVRLLHVLRAAEKEIQPGACARNLGNQIVLGDLLEEGRHEDSDVPLRYTFYVPDNLSEDEKVPLLIWLHGMGEGGEDTIVPAISNRVVNLITPEIQALFGGKAFLLVPQAPTWWMDPGDRSLASDGRTIYAEPLYRLITDFIKDHPSVDARRIYIGGDSNGGYMTVNMVIRYPELFAAAFPVCEAYKDDSISEEDLARLASVPTWFTAARTDDVVPVEEYVVPTYLRLKEAGAQTHLTLWDRVEDRSGQYVDENGRPYEYSGHWSWIPMLNNEDRVDYDGSPVLVDGKEVTLLEWVASKVRPE